MLIDLVLVMVLTVCFITDVRQQKIYNIVVMPSILAVLVLNIWCSGFAGLELSSFGFLTGLGILLIPYLLGGIGAGDVKLLAFVGAAKGVFFVLNAAIYMALVGGVVALIIMIFHKQALEFLKSIFFWLFSRLLGVKRKFEISNSGIKNKFPYGTAIVAGALICLLFKGAWII